MSASKDEIVKGVVMVKTYLIKSTNSKANRDKMVLVALDSAKVEDFIKNTYDIDFFYDSNKIFLSATEVKVVYDNCGVVKLFDVTGGDYFYKKAKTLFNYEFVKGKVSWEEKWVGIYDKCKNGTIKNGRTIVCDKYLVKNFI